MAITKATASSIAPAAKGDLVVGSATNDAGVLAVGTNTHILVADSTETLGMKWAAPSGSSGPAFKAFRNTSTQTFSGTTWTKIQLNGESFDTANNFDSTTNYRFTPTTSGYYQVQGTITFIGGNYLNIAIYKNGSAYALGQLMDNSQDGNGRANVVDLVYLNGSSDYVELYGWNGQSTGAYFGADNTFFSGVWIRS
jgi:hypothetical protein